MSVYDSDLSLDFSPGSLQAAGIRAGNDEDHRPISSQNLMQFRSWVHDTLISPRNGHLNIPQGAVDFSFWSLVIHPDERRAAVTLHWILSEESMRILNFAIGLTRGAGLYQPPVEANNLNSLINFLGVFAHANVRIQAPLQKLRNLIRLENVPVDPSVEPLPPALDDIGPIDPQTPFMP
jgi:hypothetical protein